MYIGLCQRATQSYCYVLLNLQFVRRSCKRSCAPSTGRRKAAPGDSRPADTPLPLSGSRARAHNSTPRRCTCRRSHGTAPGRTSCGTAPAVYAAYRSATKKLHINKQAQVLHPS